MSEIYKIVSGVNIAITIKITLKIIIYIDLYSLYKYLIKLSIIKEKYLIINIIAL